MSGSFVVAFIAAPLLVLTLGWTAVFLHERSLRRTGHPAGE